MSPYKTLGDVYDDMVRFGKEWVNENAERDLIDLGYGEESE